MNGAIGKLKDPVVMKDAVDTEIAGIVLTLVLGVGTIALLLVASAILAGKVPEEENSDLETA